MRRWIYGLLFFLSLSSGIRMSLAAPPPSGAAMGSVVGDVEAGDGARLSGARVVLTSRGSARAVVTDAHGTFRFDALGAGWYAVTASASGYAPMSARSIEVRSDTTTSLRLALAVAQTSSYTVLGRVTVNGRESVSTASAPSVDINARPYAAQGVTRVSDILMDQLSTTVVPVLGGGYNAPEAVALRGPDPAETLVAIDGHQVNNGNSGDFDLSLLDPADLQSVQVIYGIAPSSLVGPNTLGGAVNIRTLDPTSGPQWLLRFTGGSYGTFGETIQGTGTDGRVGYALSYHRVTSAGEVDNYLVPDSDGDPSSVGDGLAATTTLMKLRFGFGNGGFVVVSLRDQAAFHDLSAVLSSVADDGSFDSFAGSAEMGHNGAYGLDLQLPIGKPGADGIPQTTATFRHLTSLVDESLVGPAVGTSPYLDNSRDLINDDTLEFTRALNNGSLSLKFALQTENLVTDFAPGFVSSDSIVQRPMTAAPLPAAIRPLDDDEGPSEISTLTLGQTQRYIGLDYALDPTSKLHYTFALYYSDFSTFGTSLNPRFGFVWTPDSESALRVSAGSTFQSVQLPSLIVPAPLPDPVNGYISVGNPALQPEHATEYDIGYDHVFGAAGHPFHLSADEYRTDLHNGITTYFSATTCDDDEPSPACLSYPVNVADEVYTGLELRGDTALGRHLALNALYGVDSVYIRSVPASSQDGTIVPYEQVLGVPLHKASLSLGGTTSAAFSWHAGVLYEGWYNELNRAPFATVGAGVTWHAHGYDIGLAGTNLTDVYNTKFTYEGAGVSYQGLSGPIPTDAYTLPGPTLTLSLTRRM